MFNFVTLVLCFLFLIAVWKLHVPGAADDHSVASPNLAKKHDEHR